MRWIYYKLLRLVLPQVANQLGIPAEAPTFLSPQILRPQRCKHTPCPAIIAPLVYQTGQITRSPHYHSTGGGIYFSTAPADSLDKSYPRISGFFAILGLIGEHTFDDNGRVTVGRAEAVYVYQIQAFCQHRESDWGRVDYRGCQHQFLQDGILLKECSSTDAEQLLPFCAYGAREENQQAVLRFHVREGTVFYSQPDMP